MITERKAHFRELISTPLLIAFSDPNGAGLYLLGISLVFLLLSGAIWYQKKISLKRRAEVLRKQIAEDFHDELGSKLSVISMYSELVRREVPQDNELAKHYLNKIVNASNGLYLAMKDMLWTLDPAQDSLDDLLIKIKDFAEELFEDTGIDFSMEGIQNGVVGVELPLEYKRHLLLLLKEGLNNILRHAEADSADLQVQFKHNTLYLRLSDNGKGFDGKTTQQGEGLKNMRSRAEKIKGAFRISSSEKGTVLQVECPIET